MATLELKYSSNQEHQVEAIDSVCDLFCGQKFMDRQFVAEAAGERELYNRIGYANGLRISARQLEINLHTVQERNGLAPTAATTDGRLRDFTVEMETGTGKTYAYTRTIYELHRQYGLTKFIIVVPSVAIREGVRKSFASTKSHFDSLYNGAPLDVFVYDSKDMGPVGNFATSSSIQVMIINIGAFDKEYDDDGESVKGNLFHRPSESLPGGRSPRELVAECNPIVIIDEPQSVDSTAKRKKAIRSLNPLFVLRYSATHKEEYNKVYSLTPVDAFQRGLVKGICVDSIMSQEDLNGSYVRLESTKADPFKAQLTIDVIQKDASQKRKKVTVKTGDNLFAKSNENPDYEHGWIVSNISAQDGNQFVEFTNGEHVALGQAVGDVAAEAIKRAQIRTTIDDHLQKQLELYPLGIKVLSLFFIDKVEKYRLYDPVRNGEYAEIFEEEYAAALDHTWRARYAEAGVPLDEDAAAVHSGYFSQDGKGRIKNTSASASTAADISTFETIMRDKETLLSFPGRDDDDETRQKKRIQFIWSHSALKEGWDNPNVFQICTLVETKDTMTKRQKIGRGLRLCVDQNGERCLDENINVLTVIANESYEGFAKGLQSEFEKEGFHFGVLTREGLSSLVIERDGTEERLGYERSCEVFDFFTKDGLLDADGKITFELKKVAEAGALTLPEELMAYKEPIQDAIVRKAQHLQIRDKSKEVTVRLEKDVTQDPAFQELWEKIRQRTRFEVDVDSNRLVEAAIAGIRKMPSVKSPEVLAMRADLSVDDAGVDAVGTSSSIVQMGGRRVYDLPDPIGELKDVVGLTRATIKRILEGCGRLDEFEVNPAQFLTQVAARINKAKNEGIVDGIKYTKLPESSWYTMDILAVDDLKAYLEQNAWEPMHHKSLYNYIVYDSSTIERPYAEALDRAEQVKVFAKLPSKFKIETPLGPYNPDWAYVEEVDGHQRVYFVIETKGKARGENRPSEEAKIDCAQKHFEALGLGPNFHYDVEIEYHYANL